MRSDRCTSTPWRFGALFLGFTLLLLAGCGKKPAPLAQHEGAPAPSKANNLRFADCNKHINNGVAGLVEILVDPVDGIAPPDRIVFVCNGEHVHWKAAGTADPKGNKVASFKIDFQNHEWPFGPASQTLQTTGEKPTPDQEVNAASTIYQGKAYKYAIEVTKTNGETIRLDPVNLPMGN